MLDTPVLFIVFNRPDTTKKVFEAIRKVKPRQLFVAADGPRSNREGEAALCNAVREIISAVDWDCVVRTLYRDANLGCGKAVSGAINWFFEQVEMGIILEDDTLPNESFFRFCQELLIRYKDEESIAHINGSNFQLGKKHGAYSYYYSIYPMIWGWATWRRSWKSYEYTIDTYPVYREKADFWSLLNNQNEVKYWKAIFDIMYEGFISGNIKINTWDYQWYYTCFKLKKISITPNVNLVTNIGFGEEATHTRSESLVSYLPSFAIGNLTHPPEQKTSRKADARLFKVYFSPPPGFFKKLRGVAYNFLPVPVLNFMKGVKHTIKK